MDILSGETQWKSFDTATGAEMQGTAAAEAPPGKPQPPEINAAKSGDAIEVSVEGSVKFKAGGSAHHPRWSKRGRGTSRLDQRRWVRADRSLVGRRAWRRLADAARPLWPPLARMDEGLPHGQRRQRRAMDAHLPRGEPECRCMESVARRHRSRCRRPHGSDDDRPAPRRPYSGHRRHGDLARGREPYRCPERKAAARRGRSCVPGPDAPFFPRRLLPLCARR